MSGDAAAPPISTADIATDVLDSFESTETSESSATETPAAATSTEPAPVEAKPVVETPGVVKPAPSEAAKLMEEAGYPAKTKDGRDNRIPWSKNESIIANGLRKEREAWTATKTTLETERNTYKADLDELYADARGEPKAFMEKLAQHLPHWRTYLEQQTAAPAAPAQALVADAKFPDPDYTMPDGSSTFTVKGIEDRIVPWLTEKIEARLLGKVDERLKPWQERDKAEKERTEREQSNTAIRERAATRMQNLQKMPLFGALPADGSLTPFQVEVLNALKSDSDKAAAEGRRPTMTEKEAYWEVAGARLTEEDTKKRERWAKETSLAARLAPTVARSGGEIPRATGPVSTRDIALRTAAQLEAE